MNPWNTFFLLRATCLTNPGTSSRQCQNYLPWEERKSGYHKGQNWLLYLFVYKEKIPYCTNFLLFQRIWCWRAVVFQMSKLIVMFYAIEKCKFSPVFHYWNSMFVPILGNNPITFLCSSCEHKNWPMYHQIPEHTSNGSCTSSFSLF